jgi:DNA-binding CsgD family transcriptional regulator
VEQFDDHFIAHDTFYQEYSRPVGTRHTLDYFLDSDGERDVYIAAMRSACQGPYSRRAAAQFRELGDHFLRALQCREDVERASAHARHANAALDGLNLGVVVVDASARVVLANRSARELLARGSPLRMRQSGLCCVHADIDALVSEKIARALCGCPSSLRVPGEPPLHLSAVPLPATGSLSPSDRPLVMLLMRGIPAAHSAQLGRLLQEHYGLTPAEAELAQGIAAGRTLRMLASDRRVKITTVKWQLQCVMQKLGVSRQADVVRIVTAFGGAGFE